MVATLQDQPTYRHSIHNVLCQSKNDTKLGSGCDSVGKAVASDTRGPQFESSHWQKFIYILNICLLSTMYWKDENKEKEAGDGPLFLKNDTRL